MRRRWACPPAGGAAATHNSTLLHSETLCPELVLAPPPARLPIAPFFHVSCACAFVFSAIGLWYLLPIAPTSKPVVQLLVRNLHTQLSHTTSPPPLSSETAPTSLPQPLRLLCPPCFDCLAWVGLPPPNPPPHTTEPPTEPTCGLLPLSLSPASNARLVATPTTPTTALLSRPLFLLCNACEMFLQDVFMQSSRDGSYGPALRGDKGTKLKEANRRKWD